MNVLDILEQLESAKGSKAKGAILKANSSDKQLIELLDAAMNFDRKFYIKKFTLPSASSKQDGENMTHQRFLAILDVLQNREVTGHKAISVVENFFHDCNLKEQKWYSRVIRKDLKCDFGISLANDNGFKLHEFEVMLAKDGKECKKLNELVTAGVFASPKFNGYRALAICDDGVVNLHSRNGLTYENFPSIVETLEKLSVGKQFILDGEMMSDDFNAMQQSAMSSKSKKSVGDIKYHVFGWVPVSEWSTKDFKMKTKERLEQLSKWFEENPSDNVVEVKHKLIYSVADALEYEKECIQNRYEGAMLLPDIPYYLGKKSNKLLKLKTFQSMDCTVVSVYEGEGRNAGRMGGLTVKQENGLLCDVGSGWNDEDRDYIWNNQSEFLGRTLEVSYQELTPHNIMQFPTVIRWRSDK